MKMTKNIMFSFVAGAWLFATGVQADKGEPDQSEEMESISCAVNKALSFAIDSGFKHSRVIIEVNQGVASGSVLVAIASPSVRGGGFEIEVDLERCEIMDVVHLQ